MNGGHASDVESSIVPVTTAQTHILTSNSALQHTELLKSRPGAHFRQPSQDLVRTSRAGPGAPNGPYEDLVSCTFQGALQFS